MKNIKSLFICILTILLFYTNAGAEILNLRPGQRLNLKNGDSLFQQNGIVVLVNQAGQQKSFPEGTKVEKSSAGQILLRGTDGKLIWGTGGTTLEPPDKVLDSRSLLLRGGSEKPVRRYAPVPGINHSDPQPDLP